MKPTAHDSRTNSIGPVKFRKLGSVGRGNKQIHQEIPPTKCEKKIKFKKQSQKDTMMFKK